jgi:stress response protein YsnF
MADDPETAALALHEETLELGRRRIPTARVRVATHTHERPQTIDAVLMRPVR